ncbi:MAG: OmpA family protein [Prevotellaceae bacterium]|jgi:outer membrane protein OmpA-like peptidoglycan-associated protein|nr:OmpA family protein [Prevotellaceae bacterium]
MKKLFTILVCVLISLSLFAQKTKKAEKAYNEGNYPLAIEEYTLLKEQTGDSQLKSQFDYYIGESYRKMNRPDRAEKPFLNAIRGGYMSKDIFRSLGEVQLKLGKYEDALSSFESYKRSSPSDPLAEVGIASCKYAQANTFVNPFFDPKPLDRVNSNKNELGVSYFNDGLIFSSTRAVYSNSNKDDEEDDDSDKKEVYTRSGLGQARVFMASGNNGTFGRAIEVTELNKMKDFSNDGVFSYDPYSRQGFYARSDGKKSYIQFMEYKNNKWIKKDKIEIDSKREPIGHPFITPDGNRIYFTSTMAGGYGKSDIWYIERTGSGWTNPINAGDKVNTAGNEVYATVASDYLFFASDGHVGFGGFDIFASKMVNGIPQQAFNMGHPFNTFADDYNLAMRTDMEEGIFVSGRNVRGGDDIYYFKGLPSAVIASGAITDAESGMPVTNVLVELVQGKNNTVVNKTTTNTDGKFSLFAEPERQYILKTTVAGYPSASLNLPTDANRFGKLNDLDIKLSSNASVISGRVYARNTFISLENIDVSLLVNGKVTQTAKTNFDGIYKFGDIKGNTQYTIKLSPEGYFSDSKQLATPALTRNFDFSKAGGYDNDFALETLEVNKEIFMNKVDFPKEKSNLLSESFPELDRLADLFIKNPQCRILITAYTDVRTNAKTATDLTTQRADAVKSYFTAKSVSTGQLTTKGMGRNRLLISNAKTEEEHKRNNRVTYTVTSVTKLNEPVTAPTTTPGKTTTTQQPLTTPGTTANQQKPGDSTPTQITTPVTTPGITTPVTTDDYESLPFRIQVMTLKALKIDNPLFKRIKSELKMDVHHAVGADGLYRYYVGGFATKEDATKVLQQLKAMKIEGCWVRPKSEY